MSHFLFLIPSIYILTYVVALHPNELYCTALLCTTLLCTGQGTGARLEWIKSLIMHLLYGNSSATSGGLDFDNAQIKAVLNNILTCLKTAETRAGLNIRNKVSEENATGSNLTDLKMAIALLSAKC